MNRKIITFWNHLNNSVGLTSLAILVSSTFALVYEPPSALGQTPIEGKQDANPAGDRVANKGQANDSDLIRKTLTDYIEGSTNGQPNRLKSAFHPHLNLYSIRQGKLRVWSGKDYIKDTKQGQPTGESGKILAIDFENDIGVAKVEISSPKMKTPYIDYFMLLKIEGKWTIVHKMYTKKKVVPKRQPQPETTGETTPIKDAQTQPKTSPKKTKGVPKPVSELNLKLDQYVAQLQQDHGNPGVALAVLKDGKLIHHRSYGFANLEHRVPVNASTSFRLFSLTKPFIAVGIFQLIEDGKFSLDDFVSEHVSELPKSWEIVKIKHLLSHSSGLPEMSQPYLEVRDLTTDEAKKRGFKLPVRFPAGDRFEYNQTNYWLLKRVIEKATGQSLSQFITDNQFESPGSSVYFSVDSRDIIADRATPYFPFHGGKLAIDTPYSNGEHNQAASGLHTTLDQFVEWDKRFSANLLISAATKEAMWQTFPYRNSNAPYSFGWKNTAVNGKTSFGFSGSGCTAYRTFPEQRLSIIFLSNGFESSRNLDRTIEDIAALVSP